LNNKAAVEDAMPNTPAYNLFVQLVVLRLWCSWRIQNSLSCCTSRL